MKRIGVFGFMLGLLSLFLVGCDTKEEPYVIAVSIYMENSACGTKIIDKGNTTFSEYEACTEGITGYEYGDLLQVFFDGTYECEDPEAFITLHNISHIEKIGNIKTELFKQRNNEQYELKVTNPEDPLIESFTINTGTTEERKIYTYTYNDLGIKITTNPERDFNKQPIFPLNPETLFKREGNKISFLNEGEEFIKVYTKDPNEKLSDVLMKRHINPGCEIAGWNIHDEIENNYNPETDEIYTYRIYPLGNSSMFTGIDCFPDDENLGMRYYWEHGIPNNMIENPRSIFYHENEKDPTKYYKISKRDHDCYKCMYGPVEWGSDSIFGKIEFF